MNVAVPLPYPGPVLRHWFADLMRNRGMSVASRGLPLVMWSDRMDHGIGPQVNHHRDFYSLYIVRRGRGTHVIDGREFAIARGDVYAMVPGMTHYFVQCHELVTDTFHFSPALFDEKTQEALNEMPGFHALFVTEAAARSEKVPTLGGRWLHLTPSAYAQVSDAVEELRTEWESGTACGALLTRGLFFRLMVRLAREYAAPERKAEVSGNGHDATVAAALRYMEERFTETVRIEEVARTVFLSPDRFTEVFAQAMGRTPRDYLRYLRLERAKALLRASGDATMTEIAQQSGFGDPAYFTRVFRAAVGCPPSEWKRQQSLFKQAI